MTEQETKRMIYDPSKIYRWKVDDSFSLSGIELSILNDYLSNFVVSNLDVPAILKVAAAKKMIQDIIARNIESGAIAEHQEPTSEESTNQE